MKPLEAVRRLGHDTAGAAILEFALVLPIMLLLAFGSFGLGQVLLVRLVMERAVESGARHLSRVKDPGCDPTCSPGAAYALALARNDIVSNTRVRPEAVRVTTRSVESGRDVVVDATVAVDLDMLVGIGLPVRWTLSATHGERHAVE